MDHPHTIVTIQVVQGTYDEDLTLNETKEIIIQVGWNSTFSEQTSYTTVIRAPTVTKGHITLQNLIIKP